MIATSSLEAMLPDGVRSRMLNGLGGLDVHILEAGYEIAGRPLVLLVHGFPELAFSWRHTMLPLAAAGYHVVAPDLRGFGRTVGGATSFTCDLAEFSSLSKVRDMVALVDGLGHCEAAAIVGHDIGALVAAWSALARPDVFKSVVMMSAPFAGPPSSGSPSLASLSTTLANDLAALTRPRKHYILYNCEPTAHADYMGAAQGLASFFRAYFHHKSGDWAGNRPSRLSSSSAEEMARMPTYYIMDLAKTMPQSVADHMPSAECPWLGDDEIALFAAEYARTGFQAALNAAYRPLIDPANHAAMTTYAGRKIDVPALFVGGTRDWGLYQSYGAMDAMDGLGCSNLVAVHLVEGAGHWVQQERPAEVNELLLHFLREPDV